MPSGGPATPARPTASVLSGRPPPFPARSRVYEERPLPGPSYDSARDARPAPEAVAARAGVSRATVSRVVNGGAGVREPLVDQVRKAVEERGYVPNHAARPYAVSSPWPG